MSPFSRFSGLNIRGGGQPQASQYVKTPRSPRASKAVVINDQQHQEKVKILLQNPELFAAFKLRAAKSNKFSNASACFVLHDFLDELDLPKTKGQEDLPSPTRNDGVMANGLNNGFGILNSLRTMTPDVAYLSSPRSRFACPESPQPNLSPTMTPLTPISASSSSTRSTMSPSDNKYVGSKPKPSHPACLEQPNF